MRKLDTAKTEVIMVGAAILDIPAGPVDASVFSSGSHPVEAIRLHPGGDALNESIILSRLGHKVHLISRIGDDMAGKMILDICRKEGIGTDKVRRIPGLDTGINLVLVEKNGERSFVTSAGGSLRKQEPEDVVFRELPGGRIFMLASIFVYPSYTVKEMTRVFREAKETGYLVCADMTKCKNGETLGDIAPALLYVDYLFPNLEEAKMVSGLTEPEQIEDAFLEAGVGTIVLKLGADGCLIASNSDGGSLVEAQLSGSKNRTKGKIWIPAIRTAEVVDTTGAGDTFAAAFLCGLLEGKSPEACGHFANAAASVTISEFGATTALKNREQVDALLL